MTSQQSEQQQQQQPPALQPVVLTVNQPNVMDPRHQVYYTRQPYLLRGAQFSNGCRCTLPHMILLCTLGGIALFIGISVISIHVTTGMLLLAVGGVMLGQGIHLIRIARRQFNSLPPDHPDRSKYFSRCTVTTTERDNSSVVYAVPPVQNQMMFYSSSRGEQVYLMPLPSGSHPPNLSALNGGQVHFVVPSPGSSTPLQGTYIPENDPPPAYSDVVRNK